MTLILFIPLIFNLRLVLGKLNRRVMKILVRRLCSFIIYMEPSNNLRLASLEETGLVVNENWLAFVNKVLVNCLILLTALRFPLHVY